MKTIKLILITIMTGLILQGCRKGENDPFISLKTRDARITGVWELTSAEQLYISEYSNPTEQYSYIETEELSFVNGVITSQYKLEFNFGDSTVTENDEPETSSYSEKWTVEKAGDFEADEVEGEHVRHSIGKWLWFDSAKRKTQISLDGMIYQVDRLTKDELFLKAEEKEKYMDKPDGNGYYETYSIIKRFKKAK